MNAPRDMQALLDELLGLPREEQLRRITAAGGDATLLELVNTASRLTSGEAGRALDATSLVMSLADAVGTPIAQARARRARARALSYSGRFDEALADCLEAVHIATRHDERVEAGLARLASMHALGELGRLDEAIHVGTEARDLFLAEDAPDLAARADLNIGTAYQRQDEPAAALQCFERARPLLVNDHAALGVLDNSRGEALKEMNDFSGAEDAYRSALATFEDAGAALTSAIAEGNLADLAVREGRLERAMYYFEGARRHLEESRSPTHLARLLAEQAEAKSLLGMPRDALTEYEEALGELDRLGLALEAARARCGMGLVQLRLDRPAEAETSLAAAATAFDELGHATARAKVDLVRAELALRNGRAREAREMVTRSLAALHDRPADAAAARHLLARIWQDLGHPENAVAELSAALASARQLNLAPLLADILETRGRIALASGALDDAVGDLDESVSHIERIRGSLQADRFRSAFLGHRSAAHEALVASLLQQARNGGTRETSARAFAVAELAKSRSLLDHVRGAVDPDEITAAPTDDPTEQRLRNELARLRSELNALYSRLADGGISTDRADGGAGWQEVIRTRESELAAVESRLAAMQGSSWVYGSPVGLADVQSCLEDDERLLEYFVADGRLVLFVVGPETIEAHRLEATEPEIRERLGRLQFQIDRALRPGATSGRRGARLLDDARTACRDLDALLFAPARAALEGVRRLTIVPHGTAHLVPFHALYDGRHHLVEQFEIQTVPSAGLFVHLADRDRTAEHDRAALVVGVADAIAPRIDDEARLVGSLLDDGQPTVVIGNEATADRVIAETPGAALVHFACHGRFDRDHPFASGLRLADRWLTLREIGSLRLEANLIVLSGCETGLHRINAGDELVGLLRSFFIAGAGSMLLSLWRVHDECTSRFMSTFYTSMVSPRATRRDHAALLREAQLAMLDADPHPAFWAPFVMVGRS